MAACTAGTPPILVAHSMGGAVAQQVVQARRLAGLVLVASWGSGRAGPFRPDLPEDEPFVLTPEQARELFFHSVDDETFADIYPRLVPESPAALNDYTRGGVVHNADIGCPILVLEAEHDRKIVLEHTKEAADFYDAPLVRVLNTGHDMMLEPMAEQVAAYLNGWLTTHIDGLLTEIEARRKSSRA